VIDMFRSAKPLAAVEKGIAPTRMGTDLVANINLVLKDAETDSAAIRSRLAAESNTREINASVPRGRPVELLVWMLTDAARRTPYSVSDCVTDPKGNTLTVSYTSRRAGLEHLRVVISWSDRYHSRTGRIAFLIRDFGFEADQTTMQFLSFAQPLSVAMAASEDKSNWTAKVADHFRKEIVILLPLESKDAAPRTATPPILVHHTSDQVSQAMADLTRWIPNFAGFCSQGGSRLLEDTRATRTVLDVICREHGYFIDTRSTPASRVPYVAMQAGVAYRQVDDTISGGAGAAQIDELLARLTTRAQKSGSLLVTAPASEAFISSLNRNLSMLAHNGIRLVYVSDVLIHPKG
jgi:polysaccharide deacetylase 2 family uncharacterized protein YibQ